MPLRDITKLHSWRVSLNISSSGCNICLLKILQHDKKCILQQLLSKIIYLFWIFPNIFGKYFFFSIFSIFSQSYTETVPRGLTHNFFMTKNPLFFFFQSIPYSLLPTEGLSKNRKPNICLNLREDFKITGIFCGILQYHTVPYHNIGNYFATIHTNKSNSFLGMAYLLMFSTSKL